MKKIEFKAFYNQDFNGGFYYLSRRSVYFRFIKTSLFPVMPNGVYSVSMCDVFKSKIASEINDFKKYCEEKYK